MARIACFGAGTVGSAWAVVFARAGHSVALFDTSLRAAEITGLAQARTTLELLDEQGLLDEPLDTILSRIAPSASVEESAGAADYVQESVREDCDVKSRVFGELADVIPPHCIIGSSTSAIRGSDFMEGCSARSRALVVHPVNPPSIIPLVELCASPWTSPETLVWTRDFLEDCGMKPVTVNKEIDGFILNRLQYTLVAEALHLVGEGYCSADDVDRVMTDGLALRWATLGPFQVSHLNAPGGFEDFVGKLGPMMRMVGSSARTDYDWGEPMVRDIHQSLARSIPISDIPARQALRDRKILEVRKLQSKTSGGAGAIGSD